ncbi:Ornithine carbamoyltransferase [Geoglobus acetivorans]|uniref:Ornithine carbamoyltransferase n=1 Tax=Geoglobus acetivorans TaxID=565033 RepID=A0A0A7GER5_GEOAI|nr:Ornithine carbamoyltransferase [Geoglobus acetivorans]
MVKHLTSISDLTKNELLEIITLAENLKDERKRGIFRDYLKNKTLAMIFELPSTRTRVSFEVAMTDMGGHAIYLSWNDLQLGRGETIADTARVLSRYASGIMARVRDHGTITELARFSDVPVINGLSNLEHPCQIVADLQTIREKKGSFDIRLAWVGDGNNVCNSMILASALLGFEMKIATPEGYEPDERILSRAEKMGAEVELTHKPEEAVRNADVIYTDVWTSMGQEKEKEERNRIFQPYQVNKRLLSFADKDVIVMHCLPAHRGEEITDDVIDGQHSVVFDQAENRLHAQKAILLRLLEG